MENVNVNVRIADLIKDEIEAEMQESQKNLLQVLECVRSLFRLNNAEQSKGKSAAGDGYSVLPARYALLHDSGIDMLDRRFTKIRLTESNVNTREIMGKIHDLDDYDFLIKRFSEEGLHSYKVTGNEKNPNAFKELPKPVLLLVPECLLSTVDSIYDCTKI